MERITDITEIDFPVSLEQVYLKGSPYKELKKYKAVTGKFNGKENIFSIVSDHYTLISNIEAMKLGKQIFKEFFPASKDSKLIVFNIKFPNTRSFCNIDLISDCYTFNIWDNEAYLPFIRITNSYNRSHTLKFEIGFSRKICDNGVIFEKNTVNLNFVHYKNSVSDILTNIKNDNNYEKLKKLETEFINFMKRLKEQKVEKKYFIPLTAKIFQLRFDIDSELQKKRDLEYDRMTKYVNYCDILTKKYTDELGENAYSVFNVATAFANNDKFVKSHKYNNYQRKAGEWLKVFSKRDKSESLDEYLKDQMYLNNLN